MELKLCDGKYTLIKNVGRQYALRYGKPWRELTGDTLVSALAGEIERLQPLEDEVERLQALVDEWGIESGPPIKISAVTLDKPCVVGSNDILHLTYESAEGEVRMLDHANMSEGLKVIDHVSIYSFTDALGYSYAMMGIFGEKDKS